MKLLISLLLLSGAYAFTMPVTSRILPKSRDVTMGVDVNTIIGVGVGVSGLLTGVGIMAFQDKQVTRMEERGSDVMSEEVSEKYCFVNHIGNNIRSTIVFSFTAQVTIGRLAVR